VQTIRLADYSRTYVERFDDFAFTRFDGEKVRVSTGSVHRG
jgi:hypothetical protein